MKLSQIGEFGLIEVLKKHERKKLRKDTVIGIGDDCAVLETRPGAFLQLITTDALVENVHFKLPETSFFDLGHKALLVSISDIAAMGGIPTHALVTLGLPDKITVEQAEDIYRGIDTLAHKHKIDIIGGDTVLAPHDLFISITLLGEVEKEYLITRSGAKPGDKIFVTGKFGLPASRGYVATSLPLRVKEARSIAQNKLATAMIDSSDGLVRSVREICRMSKVGARLHFTQIPIAKGATLDQALYGGEEYELVFTSKKELKQFKCVGEIVQAKRGIKLIDDKGREIEPKGGYEHFKTARLAKQAG